MRIALGKFIGFYCLALVLAMYALDIMLPGFIPTYYYLTPFIASAIAGMAYVAWKQRPEKQKETKKISWITFGLLLAVLAGLMYKVSARFGLPFWGYGILFFIFLIISGVLFYYERGYSRRRKGDEASASHVGNK